MPRLPNEDRNRLDRAIRAIRFHEAGSKTLKCLLEFAVRRFDRSVHFDRGIDSPLGRLNDVKRLLTVEFPESVNEGLERSVKLFGSGLRALGQSNLPLLLEESVLFGSLHASQTRHVNLAGA